MRYSGIQPQYFPRLHYFARILNADIFISRDDAQFIRKHKYPDGKTGKSYQAHTPIKQAFGTQLLMIPTKHDGFKPINETAPAYKLDWQKDHLKTMEIAYGKALYFDSIFPEVASLLKIHYQSIGELSTATILWGILRLLGKTDISREDLSIAYVIDALGKQSYFRLRNIKQASKSKTISENKNLSANEKIVFLCKEYGANEDYCGGTGVAAYVDHTLLEKSGIKITVQDWICKSYPQLFIKQQGFIPNLSIIDLLMNVSPEEAVSIIKG